MGNSQSTDDPPCPRNPICKALCWSSSDPSLVAKLDEGEWFGELPRDKKKRKRSKRNSTSAKNLSTLPTLLEGESDSGDTLSTLGSDSGSPPDAADKSLPVSQLSARKSTLHGSIPSEEAKASSSSSKKGLERRHSEHTNKKKNTKRESKVKLTFVNGQFVDLKTKKGQELLEAATSEEATCAIGGIMSSVYSGHGGNSCRSSASSDASKNINKDKDNTSKASRARKTIMSLRGISSISDNSDVSDVGSVDSSFSGSIGSGDGKPLQLNKGDAISSLVSLGEGHFLTASKSDRVIKMWRVEKKKGDSSKPSIAFVRDFVGHKTGISCLEKVDIKGRFLSASKDRQIKLWDSRLNVDDDDSGGAESEEQRYLLATFDNMDRRNIHGIAITDMGSYVRPTDKVDKAMAMAMTKKAMCEGSAAVAQAAQERHIIGCSCEFATISGRHNAVKMWSVKHVSQRGTPTVGQNVAEVKAEQELKHDAVVESIIALKEKSVLLTGDRMGLVRLWKSGSNVFLPKSSSRVWSCVRTFSWKSKSVLATPDEAKQFAITSLSFLQGNEMFVSGSKSGNLRVWKVDGKKKDGETIKKEVICITGAHTGAIMAVRQGPRLSKDDDDNTTLSFSSASEDGKVLSFAIPVAKIGKCNPSCFNVVNHNIANRYFVDTQSIGISALDCLVMPGKVKDVVVTTSTNNGSINLLKRVGVPKEGTQGDALLRYRQAMEEESLTLYAIAEQICKDTEAVESRNRKLNMKTFKNVFTGQDVVSYLVDNEYAASREDAVDLGCVLATHLSLFECVSKKCQGMKRLEDDAKSFYKWSGEFSGIPSETQKLAKSASMPVD